MSFIKEVIKLIVIPLILSGCGLGDSAPKAPTNQAEGFWRGTSSTGYSIAAVVLENGHYYSIFSKDGVVDGGYYGDLFVSEMNFSGSLENIDYKTNSIYTGTISGSVTPKSRLQGITIHDNNIVNSFDTTYSSEYDKPASSSNIAGRFIGPTNRLGAIAVLNIAQDGIVNGTTIAPGAALPRCIITGKVLPRPSGKNVYDLTLKWDNNPDPAQTDRCCYGSVCGTGEPSTGVAVFDISNTNTLYTAWINPAKTSGFLWIGQKQ
jgi:hypothetical protein